MKKTVLALGYIPKQKGGLQSSGLSLGIFDLHNSVNSLDSGVEVVIAATDIFVPEIRIDNTRVVGWSKKTLIKHSIKRFYKIPFFFYSVFVLRIKYRMPFFATLSKVVFFDEAIERVKPDVIHFHGASYAHFITALWRNQKPVVLRLHGMNGYNETISGFKTHRKMERDLIHLPFKLVTFISEKNRKDWLELYGEFACKTEVVLNGYNEELFHVSEIEPEKKYDLITIASVCDNKGQIRVLEALKRLKENGSDLKYVIIGACDDEYKKRLLSYIKENCLNAEFVDFCKQGDLSKYIWMSHAFILPSVAEGLGKVFFESLACGVPVILPKQLPIVYEKGIITRDNSLLLEDYTSNSIYETIEKGYSEIRTLDSNNISLSVAPYTWSNIAMKYITLYNDLMTC